MSKAVPPVTDRLSIALRAYAVPKIQALPDPHASKAKRPIAPASDWTLIFDTETTVDAAQSLRFGSYQFHNGDTLDEAGLIYDPEGVTPDELATLRSYADREGLCLRTRDEFVDEVFFKRAWQLRAAIVGFNLPFDISRIAIKHGSARTPIDADNGGMRDGFTFKLSHQKFWPNVRVKHMSARAAWISFAKPMKQPDSRGQRKRGMKTSDRRGHFIDVKTVAGALFARGFNLAGLSRFLKVDHPKQDFDAFDGPVTDEMARYAMGDVQATWECYRALRGRFDQLGLVGTPVEKVYSEASIGKGYLREMGVTPWRRNQPDFPPQMIANILSAYFGGRSEVRERREVRQVMLCDFLSMYPTVCTLMGLWRFVIADGMTWHDTTRETRAFLDAIDLTALQSQGAWRNLATLVRIAPDSDIFPIRAAFEGEAQTTIGLNFLSADQPLWFTLADCIASKLLTGKAPTILEAMTFAPGPVQSDLRPISIGGNPDYRVDPVADDFFKRVIELRQSIKARMRTVTGTEREAFDIEQNALKIAANATSYGIYVETNVERRAAKRPTVVLNSTGDPFTFPTDLAEMPGTYFHPLLATLITGAARLMLAICERLIGDNGLEWALCDTDSMAVAKPEAMPSDEFVRHVHRIVEWFTPLNPYAFGGPILKIEDENHALEDDALEPLYCWAVSSKRYALFNLDPDGEPIMRKVSVHGLGHLRPPYGNEDAPAEIPAPHDDVLRHGVERWHSDLWWCIVKAALAGQPDCVPLDYHPSLSGPAISRYAATTPDLLRWFKGYNTDRKPRDQVKPFGFLLAMQARFDFGGERIVTKRPRGRPCKVRKPKPIAPFDRDHAKAAANAFDRETGKAVLPSSLRSYAEALAQYHLHPESKFLNGDYFDRGTTQRRHIDATGIRHIGKESNDWERQAVLGITRDSQIIYSGISL
ncbi:hypothetical protein F9288_02860 [Sphingomonas sp. CL5.1]|uniref:hypothetical protein n=1 Tax=Sphingomonas sp. CL5.1 TaxID=2653203 RepID=UPI00158151AD|nr:hypothetical protein [Sphingomonas sp. CL5.1]QKR98703.1 hypothetical protein F9288_02860 [Sphingomonas sp. CL5.1]